MRFRDIFRQEWVIWAVALILLVVLPEICNLFGWDDEWVPFVVPGLFIAVIVFVFIDGIIKIIRYFFEKKKRKVSKTKKGVVELKKKDLKSSVVKDVSELKARDINYELKIDLVFGTKNKLLISAITNLDEKKYLFISLYSGNGEEFMNRYSKSKVKNVKTWIDYSYPDVYEFDIEDLVSKLDYSYPFIINDSYVVVDDDEKVEELIEKLKKRM